MILWTTLCFFLMSNLFSIMFQFKGRWIVWKKDYMNSISLLLKLRKFSTQCICVLGKQPLQTAKPFSSPKDSIPIENRSGIYFIPCSSCNLGYIGQIRRRLKTRLDEHRRKVKNEEIYTSSIAFHCWSYNHYFKLQRLVVLFLFPLLI